MDFDQVVRLGWLSPVGSVEVDCKRQGGMTAVPLYDAQEVALLEVVRPCVDWRGVRTARPGTRSPLAALEAAPVWERVSLAEVAAMARVSRAAVVNWRPRHDDFPEALAGTEGLTLAGLGGAAHRFRLDDPWLDLAEDPAGTDSLSRRSTDEDADALAALVAGGGGGVGAPAGRARHNGVGGAG